MKTDWFRIKKYLHFDCPLQEKQKHEIEKLVADSKWVSEHSFYPFINYLATKYKIKIDPQTKKRYLDDSKKRPISYAAHLDSVILGYYSDVLSAKYETIIQEKGLSDSVIAFRKIFDSIRNEPKSNIHLARDGFAKIKAMGNCTAYAFDVTKFFDTLKPDHLKNAWKGLLELDELPVDHYKLFKVLTKFSTVDRDKLFAEFKLGKKATIRDQVRICMPEQFRLRVRDKGLIQVSTDGIPQGSPISATLANIYMLSFDIKVYEEMKKRGGEYYRYCDDILCILPQATAFDVTTFIASEIGAIGLTLNKDKTDISVFRASGANVTCDKPINYLGFIFDEKRTYIRTSSIAKYVRKAKAAVELAKKSQHKNNIERSKLGLSAQPLYRKKILDKYFHTGKTNFVRYGLRSADIMKSPTIKNQMKKLNKFILNLTK